MFRHAPFISTPYYLVYNYSQILSMKEIIDDQTHSSKLTSKESIRNNVTNHFEQKRYNKITQGVKAEFLELVINGNCSIKKASQILNINYSSAKSLMSCFRKQSKKKFKVRRPRNAKTSEYKQIMEGVLKINVLTLYTSIGRVQISQQSMLYEAQPTKNIKVQQFTFPIWCH